MKKHHQDHGVSIYIYIFIFVFFHYDFFFTNKPKYTHIYKGTTQVVQWLSSVGVSATVQKKFKYHDVEGVLLLEVNDEDLKEDLGVHRQQERRRLIAAIRSLKIKHGYDDDDDEEEESSDDDNDGESSFDNSIGEDDDEDGDA